MALQRTGRCRWAVGQGGRGERCGRSGGLCQIEHVEMTALGRSAAFRQRQMVARGPTHVRRSVCESEIGPRVLAGQQVTVPRRAPDGR